MKHLINKLSAFLVMLMCMSATVQAEELTQQSAEGTVGTLNGREAIVVDLGGSIGKVAIATQNLDADDSNNYNGRKFSFADANNASVSGLSNGWYVPSKEEMEALMVRLTWNASKSGLWQGTKAGAEIDFGSTSLFLPAAGYDYDNQTYSPTSQCVYWTSTESGTGAYRLDMTSEAKEVKFGNKTIDTPIRPFCSLPEPTLPFSGNVLQTPPSGLETEYYSVDGFTEVAQWIRGDYSPLVAIDGNTMWVKNLVWYAFEVWVKGTITGNQVIFEKGQYLGEGVGKWGTPYEHTYLAAWDSNDNIIDLAFDYDADAKRLYLNHIQFGGSCDQNGTPVEQVDGDDEWKTHGWTLQGTGTAGPQTGSEEPEDDGHPSSANGTPVPVNFDLTTEDGLTPFTIVDANRDGVTWKWFSDFNCVWYYANQFRNADDWLITPAVLLEAGKTYQMIVNARCTDRFNDERMELAYGVAPTAGAMRNNILEPLMVDFNKATNVESYMVTVQETGDYYFGVHCISNKDKYALRVYNISVIEDVNITANENPDEPGVYYTTYYDGNAAHTLSDGATAYTATISGDNLLLTPIEDGIIPKDEAVIIRSNSSNITLSLSNSTKEKNEENRLCGSATGTAGAPDGCYILSYGQNGLGFYRYEQGNTLAAHKAYLTYSASELAKGLRMVFANGEADGIENINEIDNENENNAIYNLQGVRLNKLQKGINIVNGKKIIVK